MNFLLDSFDKLLNKNQTLEKKVNDLTARLQLSEEQLTDSISLFKTSNSKFLQSPDLPCNESNLNNQNTLTKTSINLISSNYDTNNNSRNNQLNNNSPTTPNSNMTWASIAQVSPNLQQNLARAKAQNNISINQRAKLVSDLSKFARTTTKSNNETKSIYVAGFEFIKIKDIWKALYNARFQMSRIVNIQWIGKTVLDFVVNVDYHLQFVSELALNKKFRILTFNPSCNSRAQTPEQNETAMRSFATRCIKNIINISNSNACINHFKKMSEEYCQKNAALNSIFATEWEKAKPFILEQTQTIITHIENLSATLKDSPTSACKKELSYTMDSLRKLNPNHPLLLSNYQLNNVITPITNSELINTTESIINTEPINTTSNNKDIEMEDSSSNTTAASTEEDGSSAH
jgi:hypothetical protein